MPAWCMLTDDEINCGENAYVFNLLITYCIMLSVRGSDGDFRSQVNSVITCFDADTVRETRTAAGVSVTEHDKEGSYMAEEENETAGQFTLFREYVLKNGFDEEYLEIVADFLDEYLPETGIDNIYDGIDCIDGFLDWFEDRADDVSPAAEALRLFYRCMLVNGGIPDADYAEVLDSLSSYCLPLETDSLKGDGEDNAVLLEKSILEERTDDDDSDREYEEFMALENRDREYLELFGSSLRAFPAGEQKEYRRAAVIFLEVYLRRKGHSDITEGAHLCDDYFYWYIMETGTATEQSVRISAAALRLFYDSMFRWGKVSGEELRQVLVTVDEKLDEWISLAEDM